ncbi:hypothetical protein AB0D99_16410 [Streptomyces sp. NPDC047971]
MSGIITRIKKFTRTRQGQRIVTTARRAAADPRRRAQARTMLGRLRGRR